MAKKAQCLFSVYVASSSPPLNWLFSRRWPALLIDFILFYLPGADAAAESELLCLSSPVDLLCGPVPSCLPSPQLHPDPVVVQQADLIHFEERTPPLPTGAPSDLYSFCGIKLKGSVLFAPFPSVVKCELVCVV